MESKSGSNEVKISLNPRKTLIVLSAIAVFLSVASVLIWYIPRRFSVDVGKLYALFYLDNEMNVPTYFSVLLMLTCVVLLVIIAMEDKLKVKKYYKHWFFLAIGFFYMSCDDFMLLHEKLMNPMNKLFGINRISDFLVFSWIVPYFVLVVILAISYFKFVRDLPKRSKILFMLAGFVYLFGIFAMEMIGGYMKKTYGFETREYVVASTIEEFMEMSGLILFIYGLMDHIVHQVSQVRYLVGGKNDSPKASAK